MAINSHGVEFVKLVQQNTGKLAEIFKEPEDLKSVYFKRGYGSGGANEIKDNDLADRCITQADLTAWVTLVEQALNWRDNAAVVQGDYRATIQKVRWVQ